MNYKKTIELLWVLIIFITFEVQAINSEELSVNNNFSNIHYPIPPTQLVPPIQPVPSIPRIRSVEKSPLGISITFSGSPSNIYSTQKKVGSGSWTFITPKIHRYKKNSWDLVQISEVIEQDQNNIQYRVRACNFVGCSIWSSPSSTINFSVYDRDTGDSNGNGIRNDVESYASFLEPIGTHGHSYLMHYAAFLSRLVNGTYGPSPQMYYDFSNMTEALNCVTDETNIIEIKAMVLDNDVAFSRYIDAVDRYGNSIYSSWNGHPGCEIYPTSSSTNGIPSYVQAMLNEKKHIQQAERLFELKQKRLKVVESNTRNSSHRKYRYVIYVNGMLTTAERAKKNRLYIQKLFNEYGGFVHVDVSLAYNFSQNLYSDIIQAHRQRTTTPNESKGWFDVVKDITRFEAGLEMHTISRAELLKYIADIDYSEHRESADMVQLKNTINMHSKGNIVLLAHSQGNFFANEVWEEINIAYNGNANDFIRVYGLGTPASYVAGNGYYYTNVRDRVINAIRNTPGPKPLRANVSLKSDDKLGHGLLETYLLYDKWHTSKTIERITDHFDQMAPQQPPKNGTCTGLSKSGGGNTIFYYTPSTDGFAGYLTFERYSGNSLGNWYTIKNQYNKTLLSTPLENGRHSSKFYYSATYGRISIRVQAETVPDDIWQFHLICP